MALLKRSLIALFVTCLSASADPVKLKQQTLNIISPTKNVQQQVADEAKPDVVPIYMYSRENSLDGDYKFRYETGNGIFAEERGVVLNKGTEDEANSVVGSYRYVSPEGVPIEVTYTAGVDGFRAYGAHLPVAPPAAVLPKNLAYKNVAQGPFARPQFRAVADDSDLPAAEVRTIDDNDDDQQATSQSVRNSAGSTQSSRSGLPAAQAEAEAAANELPEKPVILLVGGDEQSTVNKPLSQSPTAANEVEQPQKVDSFFDVKKPLAAEYYQQFSAPTPTTSWDQLVRNTQPSQDQSVFSPSATTPPAQQQLQQQQQQPQQQQQQQPQQLPQPQQQLQQQQQPQQQLQQQQPQQQLQQQQLQLLQQQQQQQQKLSTVENFESPKPVVSVVPVLQTVSQAVQTQPKVVPVLQRVVPGGGYQQYQQQQQQQQYQRQPYQQQPYQQKPYQQQPYQQQSYQQQQQQQQQQQPYQQQKPYQQPRFNAMPFPPAFGQHPRPAGSLRQFSVEPQQMWYVPQNQQHTRYFQMPSVPRTMELPKY